MHDSKLRHSGIIIGRRGSGKTAFLDYTRRSRGRPDTVYLNAPDVFVQILRSMRSVFGQTPLVEAVSDLWEIVTWSCVFAILLEIDDDARVQHVRDYANNIGFDATHAPEQVIQRVVAFLIAKVNADGCSIDSGMELRSALEFDTGSYLTALSAAKGVISSHKRRFNGSTVLVLMDTLEDQRLEHDSAREALSGLVRFVGNQSLTRGMLDVRFCLPAELYETVRALSTNAAKDFNSQIVLQWNAGELWKIAAHRLMIYFNLYHPTLHDELKRRHKTEERSGAISLFGEILPPEISIGAGIKEPSLTYLLRHTQLLPRHLLQILNRVLAKGVAHSDGKWVGLDDDMVLRGVAETEENVCRGIAGAYRHNYPGLWSICAAALPELQRRVTDGDLRKVFNRSVKKMAASLVTVSAPVEIDYAHFRRMLIEVGIIGKQISETDLFWEALYEYSLPEELSTSTADLYCVHPLFQRIFPSPPNGGVSKLVYPYGSRPDQERLMR
jgi:hypothetical protein